MSAPRTPLDAWAARKLGIPESLLTRERLDQYQRERLQATVAWAIEKSPFYRRRLAGLPVKGFGALPFMTAHDVRHLGEQLVCVSQDEIERVVTLQSSGTTGAPKRLFFTAEDQASIIDFFECGMATLVEPGDRVLILLPGQIPGSVGVLLATALDRLGATPIPHGFIRSLPEAVGALVAARPTSIVGTPVQVLALQRYAEEAAEVCVRLKTALLTADHVPVSLARRVEAGWGCQVFEHYGMTEMGLGGGVDCQAHAGYHLREADLYFEIVDPVTGEVLPEGDFGEIVVTTLTRRGMPLIRYRTGDASRFLQGACPCGSLLRRLDRVRGRIGEHALPGRLGWGDLTLPMLDEALFAVPALVDFRAQLFVKAAVPTLVVTAFTVQRDCGALAAAVEEALRGLPPVRSATAKGTLVVFVSAQLLGESPWPQPRKRILEELDFALLSRTASRSAGAQSPARSMPWTEP